MEKLDKEYLELLYQKIAGDCLNKNKAISINEDLYDMLPNKFGTKTLGKILKDDKIKECLPLYELMFVRSVKGSELIFGNLDKVRLEKKEEQEPFKHVWVSIGDFVLDFKNRLVYHRDDFYKAFGAQDEMTFIRDQILDPDKFAKLVTEFVKEKPELQKFAKKVIASNDEYTQTHYEI